MAVDELASRIREHLRDHIPQIREHALLVDSDPSNMAPYLELDSFRAIRHHLVSGARADETGTGSEYGFCLETAVSMAEVARGDVGLVLASPGPGLAGLAIKHMGNPEQRRYFQERVRDKHVWTFFAMTEPGRGSDATSMETRFDGDPGGGYRLHGAKRYVGNGSRGQIGVVFGRTGPGALRIRAALLEDSDPGWHAHALDMVGLRGARLSEMTFEGVPVPEERLLGQHLPPTRRGIMGAVRVFNNMRVQIAAMALGSCYAIHEYVEEHHPRAADLDLVGGRIAGVREMTYAAARAVDENPDSSHLSSAAKLRATELATEVARWSGRVLGPNSFLEHPLLEKWHRDVHGLEFMDGTSNIQRMHVAKAYASGRMGDV